MQRGKRSSIDPDVRHAIEDDLLAGFSPKRTLDRLSGDKRYAGRLPSARTVGYIAAQLRPPTDEHTWRLTSAAPEEAALVLPVLAELQRRSEARVFSLTNSTARWVAHIRQIAPSLEPFEAFRFAVRYQRAIHDNLDTADLDAELARDTTFGHSYIHWPTPWPKDWPKDTKEAPPGTNPSGAVLRDERR